MLAVVAYLNAPWSNWPVDLIVGGLVGCTTKRCPKFSGQKANRRQAHAGLCFGLSPGSNRH